MQRIRRIADANVELFNENYNYLSKKAPLKLQILKSSGNETRSTNAFLFWEVASFTIRIL